MRMKQLLHIGVALLVRHCTGVASAEEAQLIAIGDLPGGEYFTAAAAISDDGTTVVGNSDGEQGGEAFRWVRNAAMSGLGDLPGGTFGSVGRAVNGDGTVVVGISRSAASEASGGNETFRWTAQTGMVGIGSLPGGGSVSAPYAISADGTTVVGVSPVSFGNQAFRWRAETGMVNLGYLSPGPPTSQANAVSADGRVVVGFARGIHPVVHEAFRWTAETGMVGLGGYPIVVGDPYRSEANWVSPDGNIIYGETGVTTAQEHMFRWRVQTGLVSLYDPLETVLDGSTDGAYVVGLRGADQASIWDDANGVRSITPLLRDKYHVSMDGWSLTDISGISGDGRWICGWGDGPNTDSGLEAWLVYLPLPGDVFGDFNGDAVVDGADYKPFNRCLSGPGGDVFGACRSAVDIDRTDAGAGAVDLRDFAAYQRLLGGSCIAAIPFDVNRDCRVDALDFAQIEACLTGPDVLSPCPRADADQDEDADLRDFAMLQRLFFGE